jgi:hypothetical protein
VITSRPTLLLASNFELDHKDIGDKVVDCIHVAQDRDQCWDHVNMVMNLRVPYEAGCFLGG